MPVTTLDPQTALVVIDLQKGIVSLPLAHPVAEILQRAGQLAQAFRRHGLPVVLVNVSGGAAGRNEQPPPKVDRAPDWAELVPELEAQPDDKRVTKRTWGAFSHTDLEAYLRQHLVTEVVLCGVATSVGVESTARHAHELGFNVALAVDAMTDRHLEAHQHSLTRILPRVGETGTTAEILAVLDRTCS